MQTYLDFHNILKCTRCNIDHSLILHKMNILQDIFNTHYLSTGNLLYIQGNEWHLSDHNSRCMYSSTSHNSHFLFGHILPYSGSNLWRYCLHIDSILTHSSFHITHWLNFFLSCMKYKHRQIATSIQDRILHIPDRRHRWIIQSHIHIEGSRHQMNRLSNQENILNSNLLLHNIFPHTQYTSQDHHYNLYSQVDNQQQHHQPPPFRQHTQCNLHCYHNFYTYRDINHIPHLSWDRNLLYIQYRQKHRTKSMSYSLCYKLGIRNRYWRYNHLHIWSKFDQLNLPKLHTRYNEKGTPRTWYY